MKKSELKKLLKPIIKECIQESFLEEGMLSSLIREVSSGLQQHGSRISETRKERHEEEPEAFIEDDEPIPERRGSARIDEARERLRASIGGEAFAGIFEGITPTPPDEASAMSDPLASDMSEPGVNIDGLLSVVGGKNRWAAHMKGSKKKNKWG